MQSQSSNQPVATGAGYQPANAGQYGIVGQPDLSHLQFQQPPSYDEAAQYLPISPIRALAISRRMPANIIQAHQSTFDFLVSSSVVPRVPCLSSRSWVVKLHS